MKQTSPRAEETMNTTTPAASAAATDQSAARPWLASYPPQVPATIDDSRIGTLVDIFREAVSTCSTRPAAESFGKRITYAELGRHADTVASWLQSQGFGKGDRIAIMLPNVMAYPAILFGILSAGCTVVNINPLYTSRELTHQLRDAGARCLFVLENFAATVQESLPELKLDRIVLVTPGDLLGLKGAIVNVVSRYVKKAVKPFSLPSAIPFKTVTELGAKQPPRR
jgi:long-chain acyl-CoA synthetase